MNIRLLLFFLLILNLCFSQEEAKRLILDSEPITKQNITKEDLEPYLEDEDFNYEIVESEETAVDRFLQWLKNGLRSLFESIFGVEAAAGILLFIIRILPYLLLGFLVFLLLRFFIRVNSSALMGKTQAKGEVQISEEEKIIKNEDILALIKTAIANGDFRLAIRYYYLLALKYLSTDGHISWEPQKTNEDYLKDLQHTDLLADFEKITRVYDYIWYGEFKIDANGFNLLKHDFESLNSKLQQK